jgi:hypothetical protein
METSCPNRLVFLIFGVNGTSTTYFVQVSLMPLPLKTHTAGTEFLRVLLLSPTSGGCSIGSSIRYSTYCVRAMLYDEVIFRTLSFCFNLWSKFRLRTQIHISLTRTGFCSMVG